MYLYICIHFTHKPDVQPSLVYKVDQSDPTLNRREMAFRQQILAVVSILLLLVQSARGWWDTGHMLSAAIAMHVLDQQTITMVEELLLASSIAQEKLPVPSMNMVSAAHWADDIKTSSSASFVLAPAPSSLFMALDSHHFSEQHYVDRPVYLVPGDEDACQTDALVTEINLETALMDYFTILSGQPSTKTASTSRSTRAGSFASGIALRFLIHIVGDSTQPLHTAAWCGVRFIEGDEGGNFFKVEGRGNLHRVWDSMGYMYEDSLDLLCPYKEYETCRAREEERVQLMQQEAKRLIEVYDDIDVTAEAMEGEDVEALFAQWIDDSYAIAENLVYVGIEENATASDAYIERAQQTSQRQVVVAGYRMAAVLRRALKQRDNIMNNDDTGSDGVDDNDRGTVDNGGSAGVSVAVFVLTLIIGVVLALALGIFIGRRARRPSLQLAYELTTTATPS